MCAPVRAVLLLCAVAAASCGGGDDVAGNSSTATTSEREDTWEVAYITGLALHEDGTVARGTAA